jgi:hypothetical protein
MNLTELLPLADSMTDAELKEYALIFDDILRAVLVQVQDESPDSRHLANPVPLTDGNYLLCADLLTETGTGGLYEDGFANLPPELFDEVEVIPWSEAVALIPQPESEI